MNGRLLPVLAVALLIESVVGFTPWIAEAYPRRAAILETSPWVFYLSSGFAGLLGFVTVLHSLQNRGGVSCESLLRISVGLYVATLIVGPLSFLMKAGIGVFLFIPAVVLTGVGSALMWGSAIARRDRVDDARLAKFGRIAAGLTLGGFLLTFLQQLPGILQTFRWLHTQTVSWFPLFSLFFLASRVLELWSAIDLWRKPPDAATARLRMRRVHALMGGATATLAASSLLAFVLSFFSAEMAYFSLSSLWLNLVCLSMFLLTTIATARWRLEAAAP